MKTDHNPSRRAFMSQASLALSAAFLTERAGAATGGAAEPRKRAKAPDKVPREITLTPTGWNIRTPRFIDPPIWTWEPFPGAAGYVVMFAGDSEQQARTVRLKEPRFDMTEVWPSLRHEMISLIAWAVDAQDRPLCAAWPDVSGGRRFTKSPDFDGVAQKPLDWRASIELSLGHLLAPARDTVYDFEGDMPRSCWSCCEETFTGQRRLTAFPALHHPSFIFAYLAFATELPGSKHAAAAVHQAKQYGDWLLANRHPAEWRCGLFPFSTIENGKFSGYFEGANITLFRAARVGEAMVRLFQHFKEERYLAYARHLADVFVDLQRADGSWPFRVNPKDGKVVVDYTSAAIVPARLFGLLEAIAPNARYTAAREKAARWVLENPVRTRRWEGMYEDVKPLAPYMGLQHMDTNEVIGYLAHYHRGDPAMVGVAESLNRYVEDGFVIWSRDDRATTQPRPTPAVAEQYAAYAVMEVHTGIWLQSLLALHRITGKQDYLTKAINAGNTIVRTQQANGAYSTWGYDLRFGRPLLSIDWPGCNAIAALALMRLSRYVQSLPKAREEPQPL